MTVRQHQLTASDEHCIGVYHWCVEDDCAPLAVIQLLHGLGEHAARYERFAAACNQEHMNVVAHNHRGHGDLENYGHFADENGWDKVIGDVLQVRQEIAARYPKLPVVLLGHSMGSYIAQSFVMRHGGNNAALILSASTLASRFELRMGRAAAAIAATLFGKRHVSGFLNQMGLGNLNNPFKPNRTGFDWLSRDEDEVDRYVADPLCGGQFSNQLWSDLTGGMLEISSLRAIASVRDDMPVLITGGACDPVGGQTGMTRLADAYRQTGHDDVALTIYPEGRHEMLNETNRDEVSKDIVAWVESRLGRNG